MVALFDTIHDDALSKRDEPATLEEFVEFGLQPRDYTHYVGLQMRVQGELMAYGCTLEDTRHPAITALISFCHEKKLIEYDDCFTEAYFGSEMISCSFDADYCHDWLRYPRDPAEFRLAVERRLSRNWNMESAYILDTFGAIEFVYDEYYESQDSILWANPSSALRIKRYDPVTKSRMILKSTEVQKMYDVVQTEQRKIEKELAEHLACMPTEHNAEALYAGLPWIKRLYSLCARKDMIEGVCETIGNAASSPDIYKFRTSDTLVVFCGTDTCQEENHQLKNMRVDFSFYGKPNKQYTIERCAHCKQFRISLDDLIQMFESYGVPRCRIMYENDASGDFSDFGDTSVFYNMGYTVSQSAGLNAVQRQRILKCAIDTGKASKYDVMRFLRQRMNINGMKAGNEIAFQKWKEDYDFIRSL